MEKCHAQTYAQNKRKKRSNPAAKCSSVYKRQFSTQKKHQNESLNSIPSKNKKINCRFNLTRNNYIHQNTQKNRKSSTLYQIHPKTHASKPIYIQTEALSPKSPRNHKITHKNTDQTKKERKRPKKMQNESHDIIETIKKTPERTDSQVTNDDLKIASGNRTSEAEKEPDRKKSGNVW